MFKMSLGVENSLALWGPYLKQASLSGDAFQDCEGESHQKLINLGECRSTVPVGLQATFGKM